MFGMHTLVQTKRQREHLSGPNKGERTAVETSYRASTIEIDERHGVDFFAGAVRSEWAIETGYHGKRDFAYCEDVRTRRCNANIIGAMMLARTPAFVFMAKRGVANSQAFKGRTPVRSRPATTDGRGCAFKLNHHGSWSFELELESGIFNC